MTKPRPLTQIVLLCRALSSPELRQLTGTLQELATVRESEERLLQLLDLPPASIAPHDAPASRSHPAPLADAPPNPARALAPVRDPRPGTVRADIYALLRDGAKRRSDLVKTLAVQRGETDLARLDKAIGAVLENPRDARLQRIQHGVYALREGALAPASICVPRDPISGAGKPPIDSIHLAA